MLLLPILLLAGPALLQQAPEPPRADLRERPNVVILLSDDQGWGDLGCQGAEGDPTPRIDALARDGVRFTDGYVTAPMCSPSRAGLLTGRYQYRFGYFDNEEQFEGLPDEELTLAEVLRDAGYATGLVGKWHLGVGPGSTPADQGFQEFFGFLGGAHSYVQLAAADAPNNPLLRNGEELDLEGYLTDLLADESVSFVERHAAEPFFLFVSFNAPHIPLELPGEAEPELEGRELYLAVLRHLDTAVGRVLDALEASGVAEDTLVFFLSDNGGASQHGSSNRPLRGFKFRLWEGGIRIPFVMRWPRRVPAGLVCGAPVISLDLFATSAAAAGAKLPEGLELDGLDLLGAVSPEAPAPVFEERTLHWLMADDWAARQGRWKVVANGGRPRVYDLEEDPSESEDRNATDAVQVGRFQRRHEAFLDDVFEREPKTPRRGRAAKGRDNR